MRTGREVRLTRAMKLFASEREVVEEAFAGDVVGLANPGTFAIGDTLCEGRSVVFDPIPTFMPERFALLRSTDTATYKSFGKGLTQLEEEGAIQVYYGYQSTHTEPILAAVGQLQFEVVRARLESEYNVKTTLTSLPYTVIFRVQGADEHIRNATLPTNARLVEAQDGAILL
jgi:peptide chain release factor 3